MSLVRIYEMCNVCKRLFSLAHHNSLVGVSRDFYFAGDRSSF